LSRPRDLRGDLECLAKRRLVHGANIRAISQGNMFPSCRSGYKIPTMLTKKRSNRPIQILSLVSALLVSTNALASSPGHPRINDAGNSQRDVLACTIDTTPVSGLDGPVRPNTPQGGKHKNFVLHQLSFLRHSFPSFLRPLRPLGTIVRASFARKAKLRLSAEALDQVRSGRLSKELHNPGWIQKRPSIRVVTWNIERGLQYEKILQVLKDELPADIFILQEVDLDARRTDFRDVAQSLADELQMNFAYGAEFQELTQGKTGQPALHGQATLSRFPIAEARVLRFENQPKDWSSDWFQPREGGRMALVTKIQTPGTEFVIYNAHLESRGGDPGRALQMQEMLDDFQATGIELPLVIAGDLNTAKGIISPVFQVARERSLELLPFSETLTVRMAKKQKDWILASGLEATVATLHRSISASDHKPVSVVLSLSSNTGMK